MQTLIGFIPFILGFVIILVIARTALWAAERHEEDDWMAIADAVSER